MTNTRPEFLARLDVLVAAFEKSNMPKDWIPLQLMNDFPQWTNEEMDSVAAKTGVERTVLQYVYDNVYQIVREPVRIAKAQLKAVEDMLKQAKETKAEKRDRATDEAHKRAAEGASFANSWLDDMLAQHRTRQQQVPPKPPQSKPGQGFNSGMFGDWASHFANFSSTGAHVGKPWASAPGYIQNACATLEVPWPSTAEAAKKQYHAKAKKAHPDAGGKVEDFKKVQEAWELLEQYFREHK